MIDYSDSGGASLSYGVGKSIGMALTAQMRALRCALGGLLSFAYSAQLCLCSLSYEKMLRIENSANSLLAGKKTFGPSTPLFTS